MAYPNEGNLKPMSAVEASHFVREMIHREAKGPGDYERAMERLEAKYGIGFWTLDHLRKNKAKTCEVGLYARIKTAFADHCGRQAQRLLRQAELAQAVRPNDDLAAIQREIQALQARLAASQGQTERAVR
jgi:hypothetical protein